MSPPSQPRTLLSSAALAWNSTAAAFGTALAGRTAGAWAKNQADATPALGRIGDLEVRLAMRPKEVRRAQRLRYRVFFEDRGISAPPTSSFHRRDICPFDTICDHLVVVDHAAGVGRLGGAKPKIIGTYRLLRQEVAARHAGFYTAGEFDIEPLLARHADKKFLELGRSCVLRRYRSKRTIELLWRGIWAYVQQHGVDVLIGCASFEGTDPDALILPLSALRHHARAAPEWQAAPLPGGRASAIPLIPPEALDRRHAMALLPPLIKGYVRAGARFGDGVVVDRQFATTDVLAILPIAELDRRYLDHFGSA